MSSSLCSPSSLSPDLADTDFDPSHSLSPHSSPSTSPSLSPPTIPPSSSLPHHPSLSLLRLSPVRPAGYPLDPDTPGFSACPSPEELLSAGHGGFTRQLTSFGLDVPINVARSSVLKMSRSSAARRLGVRTLRCA